MNDGIYMPFDEDRFQKCKDGITWLHDTVVKSGARIIHLTPPYYDELKGKKICGCPPQTGCTVRTRRFCFSTGRRASAELGHWIMPREILLCLGCKEVSKSPSIIQNLSQLADASSYVKLIAKWQNMPRDAWLTATGHIRPGLPTGLPLSEAQAKGKEPEEQIKESLWQKKP